MERAVIVEDAARMTVSGLSVVYDYTAPVTIGASGQVTLPFDDLGLAVDLENRAIPRHDATAVLIGEWGGTPPARRSFRAMRGSFVTATW